MDDKLFFIEPITTFSTTVSESIKYLVTLLDDKYRPLSDEDVQSMLSSECNCLFVARNKLDSSIIGMATLIIYRIPYVKKAILEDLIVEPKFRGQGIATALIQSAVETAKEKQVAYIDFTSRPFRKAANHLYQKLGFEKRETNTYRLFL